MPRVLNHYACPGCERQIWSKEGPAWAIDACPDPQCETICEPETYDEVDHGRREPAEVDA